MQADQPRAGVDPNPGSSDIARCRGVTCLRNSNATSYVTAVVAVAAVAEVAVKRKTGEIRVERVCVAHDGGRIVNPDGAANQFDGGVIQTVSRTLMEQVRWRRSKVLSQDWLSYPILRHDPVSRVEVDFMDRPGEPNWGAGEPTACTMPTAIGNSVFDAPGARLRAVPFAPAQVLAALARPVAA